MDHLLQEHGSSPNGTYPKIYDRFRRAAPGPSRSGVPGGLATVAPVLPSETWLPIRAVAAKFADFDMYTDLLWPGGVAAAALITKWGDIVHQLDLDTYPGGSGQSTVRTAPGRGWPRTMQNRAVRA